MARCLSNGLNLSYVLSLVSSKMRFSGSWCDMESLASGIGLLLRGRMKEKRKRRFMCMTKNALSLSSFHDRILDLAVVSSLTSLGLMGVKVARIS